ncbi:hypothetical protein V6N11_075458 [Hibiscus sabdariffa]|uniref:DhaK domain-containing protein n=1 Tax=Hibiscus sabdariffa TaxID=183260 RepID=A0ABR2R6R8_9ROSI
MLGVGEGRLTAAIYGDIFASPSLNSILARIRVVTGLIGCLLIVKNYIGDHLSFGVVAEQTKSEDYKIEIAIVGDDCALPPPRGIVGQRDFAGTILVHKVTGVAASLLVTDIAFKAQRASEMGGTLCVALFVCTLPSRVIYYRLDPRKMEFGLRIHSFSVTPLMELLIVDERIVPKLQLEFVLAVVRVHTVSFMNSLDMAKFSTSIMKAPHCPIGSTDNLPLARIHVPLSPSCPTKSKESLSQPLQLCEHGLILELANEASVYAVNSKRDSLNDWNSKVSDGDLAQQYTEVQ